MSIIFLFSTLPVPLLIVHDHLQYLFSDHPKHFSNELSYEYESKHLYYHSSYEPISQGLLHIYYHPNGGTGQIDLNIFSIDFFGYFDILNCYPYFLSSSSNREFLDTMSGTICFINLTASQIRTERDNFSNSS